MPIDWKQIANKTTSVRAIVTVFLTVALCCAFLFTVGGIMYLIGHPEKTPNALLTSLISSIVTLFSTSVTLALNSYFNRADRKPPEIVDDPEIDPTKPAGEPKPTQETKP